MTTNKRISYIDVFRGEIMCLVVLGHFIGSTEDPLNKIILSFHMPAFFFISGMCATIQLALPFKEYFKKSSTRFKNLFKKYITWALLATSLYWLILVPFGRSSGTTLNQSLIGLFFNDGFYGNNVALGFWMVNDLLYDIILYYFFLYICKRDWIVALIGLFCFLHCKMKLGLIL